MIRTQLTDKFMRALGIIDFLSLRSKPLVYIDDKEYSAHDILIAIRSNVKSGVKELDDRRNKLNEVVDKGIEYLEEIIK